MTLDEFRELTKDLPGNTELVVWENGDATWYEAHFDRIIPDTPIHDFPVFVVHMGQGVELDFDLAIRTGIDE